MLFRYTARESGKVPIYISRERNIRLSNVRQVHNGIVYALPGGEKGSCHAGCEDGILYRKGVWNGKAVEGGDVLFHALLLDDVRIEFGKIFIGLNTIYTL